MSLVSLDYPAVDGQPYLQTRTVEIRKFVERQAKHAALAREHQLLEWRADIEHALLSSGLMSSFTFNFQSEALYRASPLCRFLRLVTLMMSHRLRTLALSSLNAYVSYLRSFLLGKKPDDVWNRDGFQYYGQPPTLPLRCAALTVMLDIHITRAFVPAEELGPKGGSTFITQGQGQDGQRASQGTAAAGSPGPAQAAPAEPAKVHTAADIPSGRVEFEPPLDTVRGELLKIVEGVLTVAGAVPQIECTFLSALSLPERFVPAVGPSGTEAESARQSTWLTFTESKPRLERLRQLYSSFEGILAPGQLDVDPALFADMNDTSKLCAELDRVKGIAQSVRHVSPDLVHVGLFVVDCSLVKKKLVERCNEVLDARYQAVAVKIQEVCDGACKLYGKLWIELQQRPTTPEEFSAFSDTVALMRASIDRTERTDFVLVRQWKGDVLDEHLRGVDDTLAAHLFEMQKWPGKIRAELEESDRLLIEEEKAFVARLLGEKAMLQADTAHYEARVQHLASQSSYDEADAVARLARELVELLTQAKKRADICARHEAIFGLPKTEWPQIASLTEQAAPFHRLWTSAQQWLVHQTPWMEAALEGLDREAPRMPQHMAEWHRAARISVRALRGRPGPRSVAERLLTEVAAFHSHIPWIIQLSSPAMRHRHWKQLVVRLERGTEVITSELTIANLLKWGITRHRAFVNNLAHQAKQESEIEQKLDAMKNEWKEQRLTFTDHASYRILSVSATHDVLAQLDKYIMATQLLRNDQYVQPFERPAREWEGQLSQVQELLYMWLEVQATWMKLWPIFESSDVRESIPENSRRFELAHSRWSQIMREAEEKRNVVFLAFGSDDIVPQLKDVHGRLMEIQKELSAFLDSRRMEFPRFYWLTNDELLKILSSTHDPLVVRDHIQKCFDGVGALEFTARHSEVNGLKCPAGEIVRFQGSIKTRNRSVAVWMRDVEHEMRATVRRLIFAALRDALVTPLRAWLFAWPQQVVLVALSISATKDATDVLKLSGSKGLRALRRKTGRMLDEIVTIIRTRGSLSSAQWLMVASTSAHFLAARDKLDALLLNGISDPGDFDFTLQVRHVATEHNERVHVEVLNASTEYQFEYQGMRRRSIQVPQVERVQRAILTTLAEHNFVLLTGPTGVGKTTIAKDIAVEAGLCCVTLPCHVSLQWPSLLRVLVGIVAVGAWCILDGISDLSCGVTEQLVPALRHLKTELRRAGQHHVALDAFHQPDADQLPMNKACGIIGITRPGDTAFQCCSSVPEALRHSFRPCHIARPDAQGVARGLLFVSGCTAHADILAAGLVRLIHSTTPMLRHPPPSLRLLQMVAAITDAILSVPQVGVEETAEADALWREVWAVVSAARSVILPLAEQGCAAEFEVMLEACFGGLGTPLPHVGKGPKPPTPALEMPKDFELRTQGDHLPIVMCQATRTIMDSLLQALVCYPRTAFLVGKPFSGKSVGLQCLAASLPEAERPVAVHRVLPHSMPAAKFFGRVEGAGKEGRWSEGVLPTLLRKLPTAGTAWLVLDGEPGGWCDNVVSLLDPAACMLVCGSAERLRLSTTARVVVESVGLSDASPASVSHAAVVVVSGDLPWRAVFQSTLQAERLPPELEPLRSRVLKLVDTLLPALWDVAVRVGTQLPVSLAAAASMTARLYNALLARETRDGIPYLSDVEFNKTLGDVPLVHAAFLCIAGGCKDEIASRAVVHVLRRWMDTAGTGLSAALPREASPAECYVSDGKWTKLGEHSLEDSLRCFDPDLPVHKQVMPTSEMLRAVLHAGILSARRTPVLLVGGPVTGKSTVLRLVGKHIEGEEAFTLPLALSSNTDVQEVQAHIESKLIKRRQGLLVPPGGRKCVILLDDLHVSAGPEGEKPVHDLLLAHLKRIEWHDNAGSSGHVVDGVDVVATTEASPAVSQRLAARCVSFYLPAAMQITFLSQVATLLLQGWMGRSADRYPQNAADVIVQTWDVCRKHIVTTNTSLHVWSPFDVFAVLQGIVRNSRDRFSQKHNTLSLIAHELVRVLGDRISDSRDIAWLNEKILDIISSCMRVQFSETAVRPSQLVFNPLSSGTLAVDADGQVDEQQLESREEHYVQVPVEEVTEVVRIHALDYEGEDTEADMAVALRDKWLRPLPASPSQPTPHTFARLKLAVANVKLSPRLPPGAKAKRVSTQRTGVKLAPMSGLRTVVDSCMALTVCRIVRAIRQPCGHCVLVADIGDTTITMASMAAWMADCIVVTLAEHSQPFRRTLQHAVRTAVARGRRHVGWVIDADMLVDENAADLATLVRRGDIVGLFSSDESSQLHQSLAEEAREHDAALELGAYFAEKVARHLHVILVYRGGPTDARFQRWRCRHPSLFYMPRVIVLKEGTVVWTRKTYVHVARTVLERTECLNDEPPGTTDRVADAAANVWEVAKMLPGCLPPRPNLFRHMMEGFGRLYRQRKAAMEPRLEQHQLAVKLLACARAQGKRYGEEMEQLLPKLERAENSISALKARIREQLESAERHQEEFDKMESECLDRVRAHTRVKEECDRELGIAVPAFDAARRSLQTLEDKHIADVKFMTSPAMPVRKVMETVCLLLGEKMEKQSRSGADNSWLAVRRMLDDPRFVARVVSLTPAKVPQRALPILRQQIEQPYFRPERIRPMGIPAVEKLCAYIVALGNLVSVHATVQPKQSLVEAEQVHVKAAIDQMETKRDQVVDLQHAVSDLQRRLTSLQEHWDDLLAQRNLCQHRASNADKLLQNLRREEIRWQWQTEKLTVDTEGQPGDVLVASAVLTLFSAANPLQRQSAVQRLAEEVAAQLPMSHTAERPAAGGDDAATEAAKEEEKKEGEKEKREGSRLSDASSLPPVTPLSPAPSASSRAPSHSQGLGPRETSSAPARETSSIPGPQDSFMPEGEDGATQNFGEGLLPLAREFDLINSLGRAEQMDSWVADEGLFDEATVKTAAALLDATGKCALVIDPFGIGMMWLRRHLGHGTLTVAGTSAQLVQTVREAAARGSPAIVEVEGPIDPALKPLCRWRLRFEEGRQLATESDAESWRVQISHKEEMEVRPGFNLFFVSQNWVPDNVSDVAEWEAGPGDWVPELVHVVNFTLPQRVLEWHIAELVSSKREPLLDDTVATARRHLNHGRHEASDLHDSILVTAVQNADDEVLWTPEEEDGNEEVDPEALALPGIVAQEVKVRVTLLDRVTVVERLVDKAQASAKADQKLRELWVNLVSAVGVRKDKYGAVAERAVQVYYGSTVVGKLEPHYRVGFRLFIELLHRELRPRDSAFVPSWEDELGELRATSTKGLFSTLAHGLFRMHRRVFALAVALGTESDSSSSTTQILRDLTSLPRNCDTVASCPPGVPLAQWAIVTTLAQSTPALSGLPDHIAQDPKVWQEYLANPDAEVPFPIRALSPLPRLLVDRHLHPSRFVKSLTRFTEPVVGNVEDRTWYDPRGAMQARPTPGTIMLLRRPGSSVDTYRELCKIALKSGGAEVVAALGSGALALAKVRAAVRRAEAKEAAAEGTWVLMHDASEGDAAWRMSLARIAEDITSSARIDLRFRLFFEIPLTPGVDPHRRRFADAVICNSLKIVMEPPQTVKASVCKEMDIGALSATRWQRGGVNAEQLRQVLYVSALFHATAGLRRRFGSFGYSESQAWSAEAFTDLCEGIDAGYRSNVAVPPAAIWRQATHLIQDTLHGGTVPSEFEADRLAARFLHIAELVCTSPGPPDARWAFPGSVDYDEMREHVAGFPYYPSPAFLMCASASVSSLFQEKEADSILELVSCVTEPSLRDKPGTPHASPGPLIPVFSTEGTLLTPAAAAIADKEEGGSSIRITPLQDPLSPALAITSPMGLPPVARQSGGSAGETVATAVKGEASVFLQMLGDQESHLAVPRPQAPEIQAESAFGVVIRLEWRTFVRQCALMRQLVERARDAATGHWGSLTFEDSMAATALGRQQTPRGWAQKVLPAHAVPCLAEAPLSTLVSALRRRSDYLHFLRSEKGATCPTVWLAAHTSPRMAVSACVGWAAHNTDAELRGRVVCTTENWHSRQLDEGEGPVLWGLHLGCASWQRGEDSDVAGGEAWAIQASRPGDPLLSVPVCVALYQAPPIDTSGVEAFAPQEGEDGEPQETVAVECPVILRGSLDSASQLIGPGAAEQVDPGRAAHALSIDFPTSCTGPELRALVAQGPLLYSSLLGTPPPQVMPVASPPASSRGRAVQFCAVQLGDG
eukprot:TRINITY_DN28782_c0_g1_i1.p1 TRINITY_DN28782_c0_g1~~TRINITY_DN28782_c0_g1_i1.p1  ORF type:complete len:4878 (+),score=1361.40 TRINITY_DN28782_c0_g1_i1:2014-14634(+)